MFESNVLIQEEFPHKVSAEYCSSHDAERVAQQLSQRAGFQRRQIRVVQPHDPDMSQKIQPEERGIFQTLAKSHIVLGLGALPLGLLVAALLVTTGPELTRSSPLMTFIALGFLFPAVGLFAAGVVSLRPDHDVLIEKTRAATAAGHWTVIAHCANADDQKRASAVLKNAVQTL